MFCIVLLFLFDNNKDVDKLIGILDDETFFTLDWTLELLSNRIMRSVLFNQWETFLMRNRPMRSKYLANTLMMIRPI